MLAQKVSKIDINNPQEMHTCVRLALAEDIGNGDITGLLVPEQEQAQAHIISRQSAVLCGIAWANEVFQQIDPGIILDWQAQDGDVINTNQIICTLLGKARALLTGERTALNFLQTLSGTATVTRDYINILAGASVKLLDTRKTIPGLRGAQKYAVRCGAAHNHRMGLYDAFLIKENHIMACGSITQAIQSAKQQAINKPIEIEVENLQQLQEAIDAGADIIMLDNFSLDRMRQAVVLNQGRVKLEVSGGVSKDNVKIIAETGVDYISIGALTKHVQAVDLSLRFI
jgi:nicotinate-nucleotide pyrophosphorylase (carboxylating)